jgi:membrane protein YqaA with SNARE-associated domain
MLEQLTRAIESLPVPARIALLILALVQLVLQVAAILDLVRRDVVRYQKKWLWVLVIVAGGFLGAIIYFGLGRVRPDADEPEAEKASDLGARERWESGLAKLYDEKRRKP